MIDAPNGIITNLFNLESTIYGFWGIVAGSVMYTFPVAYLMIADIMKYEDSTTYEAAEVLGLSAKDRFFCLTLPYMRKPMIGVVFAVFAMVITDYGVPLIVGGKYNTLAVLMYQDVIGLLDFNKGSVISMVFIIPALIAFGIDYVHQDKGNMLFVIKPFVKRKRRIYDRVAYCMCIGVSIVILLPLSTFIFLSFIKKYPTDIHFSFVNILHAVNMNAFSYLLNSLFIAFIVGIVGIVIAITTAYITSRTNSKLTRPFHFLAILTLTIPGLVLGLAYILFFKSTFIYGTFAILILVNIMHFFASPYLMMYNTFNKINKNLESVGRTLGLSKWSIIKDVILPQSKNSILEIFGYFFINSMVTISAVSFLANINTKPISLMISMFEAHMLFESSAFISLIILVANLICKGVIEYLKRNDAVKSI